MKIIKITNDNVQEFAEDMFNFNCFYEVKQNLCYGLAELFREEKAFFVTDILIEEMSKAGFNIQAIEAFKKHNWKVDDLNDPVKENPSIYFSSNLYENFFTKEKIEKYYTDELSNDILEMPY